MPRSQPYEFRLKALLIANADTREGEHRLAREAEISGGDEVAAVATLVEEVPARRNVRASRVHGSDPRRSRIRSL